MNLRQPPTVTTTDGPLLRTVVLTALSALLAVSPGLAETRGPINNPDVLLNVLSTAGSQDNVQLIVDPPLITSVHTDWNFGGVPNESQLHVTEIGSGCQPPTSGHYLDGLPYYENAESTLAVIPDGPLTADLLLGVELIGGEGYPDSDVGIVLVETEEVLELSIGDRAGFQGNPFLRTWDQRGALVFYESDPTDPHDSDGAVRIQFIETVPDVELTGVSILVNSHTSGNVGPQIVVERLVETFRSGYGGAEPVRLLIAWESFGSPGDDSKLSSVQATILDENGNVIVPQWQVNTTTAGFQRSPDVTSYPDGGFAVVWTSDNSAGTDQSFTSVQLQRYDADGVPIGGEVQVNEARTTGFQYESDITVDENTGNFLVSYTDDELSIGDTDIWMSVIDPGGAIVDEFQVNQHDPGAQERSSIAWVGGDYYVAWTGPGVHNGDPSGTSVQFNGSCGDIFSDGFESGDTSAWE